MWDTLKSAFKHKEYHNAMHVFDVSDTPEPKSRSYLHSLSGFPVSPGCSQ